MRELIFAYFVCRTSIIRLYNSQFICCMWISEVGSKWAVSFFTVLSIGMGAAPCPGVCWGAGGIGEAIIIWCIFVALSSSDCCLVLLLIGRS